CAAARSGGLREAGDRALGDGGMKVPLLDLQAQYASIKTAVDAAIAEVMASQQFILGPQVRQCEEAVAKYCSASEAIGVSSGTDALLACLMAEGIGPGDEVITTPYSFFATAGCVSRVGAKSVFVDVDPASYNINPHQIAARVSPKTKAIIPVHLFGQMADMEPIMRIARERKLIVIEDAAQAIGAEHRGKRAGSIGEFGCFSFFPSKNLGAAGDAGLVVTNDKERAAQVRCLRNHGAEPKYVHRFIGGNFRLDSLQAAVVLAKLPFLDGWTASRENNARRYNQLFAESGLRVADTAAFAGKRWQVGTQVFVPRWSEDRHIYNQYVIRVRQRDELKSFLLSKGIGTEVYYPIPLHLQECFAYLGYKAGEFPESESAANETLALPVYAELTEGQARYVVESIKAFFAKAAE
ncbi:MAG TPA: DegT/DnrJ/EryC1/StrS family aminotransferase, partial [Candidatus Binatia bacterium]|nr:DegT/DnrJ/EryC1/StrS family aminotransferase [Candidatus Binatia bacterium]